MVNIQINKTVAQQLEQVDWHFADNSKSDGLDSIHPYPAKFIPAIPRTLLSILQTGINGTVFDPFCGSGTTLVEAQRVGVQSIGVDLNPIACLISRVKTTPVPARVTETAQLVASNAREYNVSTKRDIPNVDHWFQPEIQDAIIAILHSIQTAAPETYHDILHLALSSILVRISNQESDTRYAAIVKDVSKTAVFDAFANACTKVNRALMARTWEVKSNARVIQGNTLMLNDLGIGRTVGIVITSPPYPNAYEYWLYHKYRMWWLGFDPLAVKEHEIGARAHFFKRNHHTEENFWTQMRATMALIETLLVTDGYACFVVGRSKIHGRIVDNAAILTAIAKEFNWKSIAKIDRLIAASRKSFNLSHANIKTETILVFQRAS